MHSNPDWDGVMKAKAREEKSPQTVKWSTESDQIHRLTATLAALREAAQRLLDAYDVCDSNRGAFSCHDPHDLRCPKDRAASPAEWKGEWVCKCGREDLEAALAAVRALSGVGLREDAPPTEERAK